MGLEEAPHLSVPWLHISQLDVLNLINAIGAGSEQDHGEARIRVIQWLK